MFSALKTEIRCCFFGESQREVFFWGGSELEEYLWEKSCSLFRLIVFAFGLSISKAKSTRK